MLLPVLIYLPPLLLAYVLIRNYTSVQRSVPGPLLARLTNLHRLCSLIFSNPHEVQTGLHEIHGSFVRLGPDMVSVQGASYVSQIYGIGKGFVKSDFYSVLQNVVNGRRTASLVAMIDETDHARTKRVIAHAYSLSTLVEFEPLVDSTIRVFLNNLSSRFAKTGEICDLGQYLQYFAFDVIGELTFSKRLGFIEQNTDVDGIISAISNNFRYFSVIGQMPWLDRLLDKNPIYLRYFRKPISSPILIFGQKLLQQRLSSLEDGSVPDTERTKDTISSKPDFLSRFLQARKETDSPDLTTDAKLLSYLFMNINAGSDTIASTLKALFHYLITNPSSLTTLRAELSTAHTESRLSTPCPTYAQAQALPYLQACIKETLRLNPALSLPLERVVPAGGVTLSAGPKKESSAKTTSSSPTLIYFKQGTILGINPYVQHRDPTIFDASGTYPVGEWHPERWLTPQEKTSKYMEHNLLAFGAGKRSCLGKHIALLEVNKVVPAVLMKFGLASVGGGKEWRVENKFVLDQKGLRVHVVELESTSKKQRDRDGDGE